MTGSLFDLLLVTLAGVQALGFTFGIAALATVGFASTLKGHTEKVYLLILSDPIVRRPLMRAELVLAGLGLAAYAALTAMIRWLPY